MANTRPLADRLWARVRKGAPDECWPWEGYARPGGHGQIGRGRREDGLVGTHVAAWEVTHDQRVPSGLVVRHTCDNPPCCNPAHLLIGTSADNARDAKERGRARGARGTRSPFAKLTTEQVGEIRRRYRPNGHPARREGTTPTELAREFGITTQYVYAIVSKKWRRYG